MYKKYPRTPHLPWSQHVTSDDKIMTMEQVQENFKDKQIVVTVKMDGENTTMYNNYIHARSIDSKDHPSRAWVKQFWGNYIKGRLNENERICGENCFAKHSILYENLPSYFLGFSFWRDDLCLSWSETLAKFENLGVTSVPVLYEGIYDEMELNRIIKNHLNLERDEGYVLRLAGAFDYNDFSKSVAKFVRANHVATSEHWMHSAIVKNKLAY
jgi:hypothetical protein